MKRVKSCSTLRLKVHQLLNEEEREILKYAIRIYRKNQSIDNLCDILSKIITDANRSCLVTLIADMLKDEQRSQFLNRCYLKLPSYSVSQQQLTRPELQFSNTDYQSNTFSMRVATFVSKNRSNQSKSNLNLVKHHSKFEDNESTIKGILNRQKNYFAESNNNGTLKRSDSEELLKTIEKCTIKERPRLSNLQDKGFWRVNNDSPTDDDSITSSSSNCDKSQQMLFNQDKYSSSVLQKKETPRFFSKRNIYNSGFSNGIETRLDRSSHNSRKLSNPNQKSVITKFHFSSVNNIDDSEEQVDEIPSHLQSLATVFYNATSSENVFVQYQSEMPSYLQPSKYKPIYKMKCKSIDENINAFSAIHELARIDSEPILNTSFTDDAIDSLSTDQASQTSPILTCHIGTQTFLA